MRHPNPYCNPVCTAKDACFWASGRDRVCIKTDLHLKCNAQAVHPLYPGVARSMEIAREIIAESRNWEPDNASAS